MIIPTKYHIYIIKCICWKIKPNRVHFEQYNISDYSDLHHTLFCFKLIAQEAGFFAHKSYKFEIQYLAELKYNFISIIKKFINCLTANRWLSYSLEGLSQIIIFEGVGKKSFSVFKAEAVVNTRKIGTSKLDLSINF